MKAMPTDRVRQRLRAVAMAAACLAAGGCVSGLGQEWARIQLDRTRIPIFYTAQSMILSIDGHRFGSQYASVRVPAGYHEIHAVFIDCGFPLLVVTCYEGALEQIIPLDAVAGRTYTLQRGAQSAWAEPVGVTELRLRRQ